MISYEARMWWAVLATGLVLIGLAIAAKARNWWLVTAMSGLFLAGSFAVMMECMWWMSG